MTYTIRQLTPVLGAEVSGIDLNAIGTVDAEKLRQSWLQYHVVLVRQQKLTEATLVSTGQIFGQVENARRMSPLTSRPEIMVISNIRENGQALGALPDGELYWHYDRIHQQIPNKAGILHAIEIPQQGGETRFADMCAAYNALTETLKRRISGLTALNTYQYGQTRAEDKALSNETPSAIHPIVRTIPESGRKALYICRLMTDRIMELQPLESSELLETLFGYSERAEFTYEHQWQPDDVIIWDNRCVMHARNDFDERQRRLLKRVTVADNIPPR